ncbi:MAG: hypothetical protein JNM43_27710 [Planctomycetaceae bacterium]|nr:hypothetical protein [Planctomycetaceae bacterium]
MIDLTPTAGQYSANVTAVLVVDGQRLPLSKLSPTTLYLRQGAEFNPGPAVVELVIDQTTRFLNVDVLHPGVPFENEVLIRHRPSPG